MPQSISRRHKTCPYPTTAPMKKMKVKAPKIELNPVFLRAFQVMNKTKHNVFVTGKAGTGKSTLLRHFRENTKKTIVVLAPTGVAALNVQGQTIHSFFRFPTSVTPQNVRKKKPSEAFAEMLRKLDDL